MIFWCKKVFNEKKVGNPCKVPPVKINTKFSSFLYYYIETNFVDKGFKMEYQNRSPIDTIESRLSNIERRVYGKSNPSFKEKEDAASEVIK